MVASAVQAQQGDGSALYSGIITYTEWKVFVSTAASKLSRGLAHGPSGQRGFRNEECVTAT
jgi:hypothetical protein